MQIYKSSKIFSFVFYFCALIRFSGLTKFLLYSKFDFFLIKREFHWLYLSRLENYSKIILRVFHNTYL